jgi:hypothetical protein
LYVGGGLWIRNGYVNGCTIAENACLAVGGGLSGYAGGVEPDYGYTLYLDSCIIYGNQSLIEPQIGDDGTSIVTYCDVQGGYTGTGNIEADPLFNGGDIETVGITAYDLQTGSPCRSAGNPAYSPVTVGGVTETAIDGGPRIPDTVVDMGAF